MFFSVVVYYGRMGGWVGGVSILTNRKKKNEQPRPIRNGF